MGKVYPPFYLQKKDSFSLFVGRLSIPLEDLLNMLQSNASFVDTRKVLVEQIDKKIEELDKSPYWDWEVNDESAYPPSFYCQFQMFAQLNPVPKEITQSDLLDYEKGNLVPLSFCTLVTSVA